MVFNLKFQLPFDYMCNNQYLYCMKIQKAVPFEDVYHGGQTMHPGKPQTFPARLIYRLSNILNLILEYFPDADRDVINDALFLMQEYWIRTNRYPVIALDFEVWQQGPVQKDLYADLSGNMWITNVFLERYHTPNGDRFKHRLPFDGRIFRVSEEEEIRAFLQRLRWTESVRMEVLVKGKESLWYKTAEKAGVLNALVNAYAVTTDVLVDFTFLFDDEDDLEEYCIAAAAEFDTEALPLDIKSPMGF